MKTTKMTQSKLARTLSVRRQIISYHCKGGGAPALDDVDGWREFLSDIGREGSLPADVRKKIGQARARLITAQAVRAERENKNANGETMLTADAIRQAAAAMVTVFAELERRDRELPPVLAGLEPVEIYKRMMADTEKIRATLKSKFDEVGQ